MGLINGELGSHRDHLQRDWVGLFEREGASLMGAKQGSRHSGMCVGVVGCYTWLQGTCTAGGWSEWVGVSGLLKSKWWEGGVKRVTLCEPEGVVLRFVFFFSFFFIIFLIFIT